MPSDQPAIRRMYGRVGPLRAGGQAVDDLAAALRRGQESAPWLVFDAEKTGDDEINSRTAYHERKNA